MSKAWKDCEREVARALGGTRRVRISYAESCEDVIHPTLAVECKYGNQVPKGLVVEHPTLRGFLVLVPSKYLHLIDQCVDCKTFRSVDSLGGQGFAVRGLAQALSYNKDKTPVLCVKRPRTRGFVFITYRNDYQAYVKRLAERPLWARMAQGLAPGTAILPGSGQ